LSAGVYSFTAMATDLSGFSTPLSAPYQVVIDTHVPNPPVLNAVSPETGSSGAVEYTNVNTPTFSGWTEPFAVVALYSNSNGNTAPIGATEADISGYWSFTVGQPGQVTDPGASSSILSSILNPILGLLGISPIQQSLSIVGTAPPNDSVQVDLNGTLQGTATANAQGNWSYSYVPSSSTVANGIYSFAAITMDASGNVSMPSPTFQLQVGGGSTATTPQYASGILSGQATPGSLVTIVDGDVVLGIVVANSSGNWQFTPTLSKGKHSIMAEATNSAGDTSLLSGALAGNV
jgi:large repetitive protein